MYELCFKATKIYICNSLDLLYLYFMWPEKIYEKKKKINFSRCFDISSLAQKLYNFFYPKTWKCINVKINGWSLTFFFTRSHELTFSSDFSF